MRLHHILIIKNVLLTHGLCIIIALFAMSCEKTVVQYVGDTQPVDNNKAFTVIPDSVNVSLFEEFTIKARLENRPLSDVLIEVSVDTSTSPVNNCLIRNHNNWNLLFIDTGQFSIKVQAFDAFADTLIASKNVPAVVKNIVRYARIEPRSIDTFFHIYPATSPLTLYYRDNTNINSSWNNSSLNYPKSIWNFGNDRQYEQSVRNQVYQYYSESGIYVITLSVYDHFNRIWAQDSITAIIRPARVTDQILSSLEGVTVGYNPSQTSPIYETVKYNVPFIVGFKGSQSQAANVTWGGDNFSYTYYYDNHTNNPNKVVEYKLTGRLSSGRDKIEYVNLSVADSLPSSSGNESTRFGFQFTDLEIIEFNNSRIVYRTALPVESHVSNEYYTYKNKMTTICGYPDQEIIKYFEKHSSSEPYVYIYFSRK